MVLEAQRVLILLLTLLLENLKLEKTLAGALSSNVMNALLKAVHGLKATCRATEALGNNEKLWDKEETDEWSEEGTNVPGTYCRGISMRKRID